MLKRQHVGSLAAQTSELGPTVGVFKATAFGHPGFVSAGDAFGLERGDPFHRSVELEDRSDPQDPEDLCIGHALRSQGVWCLDPTYKVLRMFLLTACVTCRFEVMDLACEAKTWFATSETPSRILPAMLPMHGYQGFRTAPPPSGWVQLRDTWVLWWSGRQIAQVSPAKERGVRVHLDARKMWQTKDVWAASVDQGKRYAERWCAARLYPEMRLRAAVARMVDGSPGEPLPPLPGLPPTPEQLQQARRLAEAGAKELERVKEALAPIRPPAAKKPRAKDPQKARVRAALRDLRGGV